MSSLLDHERHQLALRLEKEIIGDPLPGSAYRPPHSKFLRAERQIGLFLRYQIDEQALREALEQIASTARKMGDISLDDFARFGRAVPRIKTKSESALRAAAALIKPRDMAAAVEKVRQRDEATRLAASLVLDQRQEDLATGAVSRPLPFGAAHGSNLSNQQLQNQITSDFRANVRVSFGHVPLPSQTDDGSK